MKYKFPKIKQNSDETFGPTKIGHFYKPLFYHNKSAKKNSDKTRWVLKKNEQFEVFKVSDEGNWECNSNNGNFSILSNGDIILGENEERLAFFPKPSNTSDVWHGYPVESSKYEPSETLVDKWLEDEVIDDRVYIKILKGQI
jgi:hypothetical protein